MSVLGGGREIDKNSCSRLVIEKIIRFPERRLKWIFIILATLSIGMCFYESGIMKNSYIPYYESNFSSQHGQLPNKSTRNPNRSNIYEDKSLQFLLMKSNLTESSEMR
ncbi:uncharacterized protein LOC117100560 [Anneissia japonica]|uniref:uncharacterized protein LOC117100560 n=1 Tax=Anneissia japonica TaxID=1529436 RepID=UPI0014255BA1|nr:uncharacterized protein LOC117100560 [Anneissia japonica]